MGRRVAEGCTFSYLKGMMSNMPVSIDKDLRKPIEHSVRGRMRELLACAVPGSAMANNNVARHRPVITALEYIDL